MFDLLNRIATEDAREILKKHGLEVSLEDTKIIVEYLYIFVDAVLEYYVNLKL